MTVANNITRREWVVNVVMSLAAVQGIAALFPDHVHAEALASVTVYKDPDCGCCKKWVEHLRSNGFGVTSKDRTDMDALKDSLGIPPALRSCHTAVIGKYFVEGHVPAADVKRVLAAPPAGLRGLAVPGMPAGSPGMEASRTEKFSVIALTADGKTSVFATHG